MAASPAPLRSDQEAEAADAPLLARVASDWADVVVVEEDATVVEMLTYTLGNRGYRCVAIADGRTALEQLRGSTPSTPPPVLVINIDLPGLGRVGVIEQLERAHPEGFRMIALTRTGSEREQVRALNAGAIDYFVKPISMPVLTAKIIRFLWDHPRR